jgi:transcriptional regulator with XRE-family HTH domain
MDIVGNRIRLRRQELQMKVAELARVAGIASSTLYDLERGDMRTTTKLHRIAAALGLSIEWLESGRGSRLSQPLSKVSEPRAQYSVHGLMMTPETARVAQEWEKLDEPMRAQVALIIESLVATQIRATRRKLPATQQESASA